MDFATRHQARIQPDIVLFDWDDTLFDHDHLVEGVAAEFINKYINGSNKPTPKELVSLWYKDQQEFCNKYFPGKQPTYISTIWNPIMSQIPLENTRLLEGAKEALTLLKKKGMRLGIISNKPDDMLKKEVEHFGLTGQFAVIVGHKEGMKLKPDPTPVLDTLREHGIPLNNIWYIGDSPADYGANRSDAIQLHIIGKAHTPYIRKRHAEEQPSRYIQYFDTLKDFSAYVDSYQEKPLGQNK